MRAPDDVKEALATLGFTAKDFSPADDPAYTEFRRSNPNGSTDLFHICFAVEGKAISAADLLDEMMNGSENIGDC